MIRRIPAIKALCIVTIQIGKVLHGNHHLTGYTGNNCLSILSKLDLFRRISVLCNPQFCRKFSTCSIDSNIFSFYQSSISRPGNNNQFIPLNRFRVINISIFKNPSDSPQRQVHPVSQPVSLKLRVLYNLS